MGCFPLQSCKCNLYHVMGTLAATPPACSAWDVPGVPARVGRGSHSRSGRRRPTRSRLTLPAQRPSRPARSADAQRAPASAIEYRILALVALRARAFRRRASRCPRPGFSPSHIGRKSFFTPQKYCKHDTVKCNKSISYSYSQHQHTLVFSLRRLVLGEKMHATSSSLRFYEIIV